MRIAAGQAQRIPAREAVFRNLYLNQRIDANPRFIAPIVANFDVRGIGFDRWRIQDLKKLLEVEGIELPLVEFGQGMVSMAPAVDEIERLVLSGQMAHGMNPVLTWNIANVAIEADATGNRKFNKRRSTGRIDGAVALAMAVGLHAKQALEQPFVFDPSLPVFLEA